MLLSILHTTSKRRIEIPNAPQIYNPSLAPRVIDETSGVTSDKTSDASIDEIRRHVAMESDCP